MSNYVDVIKACESASGAGSKKVIHEALARADSITQRLIKETQDPYRVFGVKKFDMPKQFSAVDNPNYDNIVFQTLDSLASRELTGNAARTAVTNLLAEYTKETATYLARVINKDPKAGFSADTMNKIFPDLIPTFNVMLADKYDTDVELAENFQFPCDGEAKYDGERTIAIVYAERVVYYSRSGKEAKHVDGLFDEELFKIRSRLGYDFVIDGERYASNFTETMNAKKEGNDTAKDNLRFYAFHYMSLLSWQNKTSVVNMRDTRAQLDALLAETGCEKVMLSKGRTLKDFADAKKFFDEMVAENFEGLILKQPDAFYEWDRSKNWVKWKPKFDVDGTIVGFYKGRKGTKYANTLGGVNVEGEDERDRKFKASVGSGFSDEMRNDFWNNQDKYLGVTITVEFQEYSQAKNSDILSLRFPVIKCVRDDK